MRAIAPPWDDGLAVNFGEVLERWSGGIGATPHRVPGAGEACHSLVFFHEASGDAPGAIRSLRGRALRCQIASMRDRFIGAAGMLWGGFLLGNAYLQRGRVPLDGARLVSLVFAVLFVIGGAYYLFKPRKPEASA